MQHTQNFVLRTATQDYLATINPQTPPPPSQVESELLEETRLLYANENSSLAKGEKWRLPTRLSPWQVAQILLKLYVFRRVACGGLSEDTTYDLLCMYQQDGRDKGIYVTDEMRIRRLARQYDIRMTQREFDETISYIEDEAPRVEPCTDQDLVAVNNGIFNYKTKRLMDFTPEIVFTTKSRVNYRQNVANPVLHNAADGTDWDVESWMHTLSDDQEVVDLLWEILGAIIRPHVPWNKSAWFYSESGNNGKGTLCELMRQLCGDGSYAAIKLDDMGKDFALEPLIRASAIIVDENDVGTFVDKAANLKAIITGDVVQINRKFKQPIPYRFRGFMVQCLNEMPRIKDKSDSFYRRQLFIPFEKCFTGMERKYIKTDYLHRDAVLEYVLHKVLHTDFYNLSEPEVCKDALEEYKGFNDPVRQFWDELHEEFKWDLLPNMFLYDLYRSWFNKNVPSGSPVGKNTFMKEIVTLAEADGAWEYQKVSVRRASKMDDPEPLIAQYNLRDWMNLRYLGANDLLRLCTTPVTTSNYKGLLRAGTTK